MKLSPRGQGRHREALSHPRQRWHGLAQPSAQDHAPAGPPASPAVGEFSPSAASASLPVSSGPFLTSPGEPSASAQKPHTCAEKVLRRLWENRLQAGQGPSSSANSHRLHQSNHLRIPKFKELVLTAGHTYILISGHLLRAARQMERCEP